MPTKLVDPFAIVSARLAEIASTAPRGVSHEIRLDPPPGAVLQRLTVAGAYRSPVPIMYDFATRTAYPIRSEG